MSEGIRFISREAFPSFNPATLAPAALAVGLPAIALAIAERPFNRQPQAGRARPAQFPQRQWPLPEPTWSPTTASPC